MCLRIRSCPGTLAALNTAYECIQTTLACVNWCVSRNMHVEHSKLGKVCVLSDTGLEQVYVVQGINHTGVCNSHTHY